MTSAPNASPPATGSGAAGRWFTRWRKDPGAAVPGLAAVVLGFVVGYLTGGSGPDGTVLAAVLPAVLSAAGAIAAFLTTRGYVGKRHTRAVGGLIVLFSVALLVGVQFGASAHDTSENRALRDAAAAWQEVMGAWEKTRPAARKRYIEDLKECTFLEFRMNAQRKDLELPPFTISQVCPFLDNPHTAPAQTNAFPRATPGQ